MVKFNNGSKAIVVAGGVIDSAFSNSSELIHLDSIESGWIPVPDLPLNWAASSAVPFKDTFLVVGGVSENGQSNYIYEYDTVNNGWITRPERLTVARYQYTAFLIPDEVARCS